MKTDYENTVNNVTVLKFSKKAGRPKSNLPKYDSGTPELAMKRARNETAEALDLCLERGIINKQQHWCGMHFRWLYTLRHGAPGIHAIDPSFTGGTEIKQDDPEWRNAREMEYHEAVKLLLKHGQVANIMNICVYNERPAFLTLKAPLRPYQLQSMELLLCGIRDGLDLLTALWQR